MLADLRPRRGRDDGAGCRPPPSPCPACRSRIARRCARRRRPAGRRLRRLSVRPSIVVDLGAVEAGGQHQAAAHDLAIHPHRAGAADAMLAAGMRAGQAEVEAQEVDQVPPRLDAARHALAIDRQGDVQALRSCGDAPWRAGMLTRRAASARAPDGASSRAGRACRRAGRGHRPARPVPRRSPRHPGCDRPGPRRRVPPAPGHCRRRRRRAAATPTRPSPSSASARRQPRHRIVARPARHLDDRAARRRPPRRAPPPRR